MEATRREITITNPTEVTVSSVDIGGQWYVVDVPPHSERRYWLYEVGDLSQIVAAT